MSFAHSPVRLVVLHKNVGPHLTPDEIQTKEGLSRPALKSHWSGVTLYTRVTNPVFFSFIYIYIGIAPTWAPKTVFSVVFSDSTVASFT